MCLNIYSLCICNSEVRHALYIAPYRASRDQTISFCIVYSLCQVQANEYPIHSQVLAYIEHIVDLLIQPDYSQLETVRQAHVQRLYAARLDQLTRTLIILIKAVSIYTHLQGTPCVTALLIYQVHMSSVLDPRDPGVSKHNMAQWLYERDKTTTLHSKLTRAQLATRVQQAQPHCLYFCHSQTTSDDN